MSEPGKESGTPAQPVEDTGWEAALAKTLAASEPDPSDDKPTVTDEKVETAEEVKESPTEPVADALQPLESWSDEVKTNFRTLDKTGQQFLLDRHKEFEGDYTKKTQEVAEIRKRYERLDDVLKPYDEVARRQGIDLTPHISQALNYYMSYQRDPASTLKNLIQAANLNAEALGFGEQEADPTIRALRSELEKTQREVANLKQGTTQAVESQYVSQINSFKDAKDEAGNLKHPYFDRVRTLMAPLVDAGKTLDEAYTETVWAVPEYRQSQEKASKAAAEKEAKEKAETARLAKVKNAKSAETLPATDTDKGKSKTPFKNLKHGWEDALKETLSQLQ